MCVQNRKKKRGSEFYYERKCGSERTSYFDLTWEQRGWPSKAFWLRTRFHLFCRCCSWCPQSAPQTCTFKLKKTHTFRWTKCCGHTDLTKEVVHKGSVVHRNLHFVIVLIAGLPWTKPKASGLIVLKGVYHRVWLHSSYQFTIRFEQFLNPTCIIVFSLIILS